VKKCLEKLFVQSVDNVDVIENGWKANLFDAYATTGTNTIYLSKGLSCSTFFSSPLLLLEEYYHVLAQWNTGRMNHLNYALEFSYDNNKWEKEAKGFAMIYKDDFQKCLKCPDNFEFSTPAFIHL
jgi:hypothetical protein